MSKENQMNTQTGSELEELLCSDCGEKVSPADIKCSKCGAEFETITSFHMNNALLTSSWSTNRSPSEYFSAASA